MWVYDNTIHDLILFLNKHFVLKPESVVSQRPTSSMKVDGSCFVLSDSVPQRNSL